MPELNGAEPRRPEPPVISAVVLADLTDVTAAEVHDGDQRHPVAVGQDGTDDEDEKEEEGHDRSKFGRLGFQTYAR